MVQIWEADGWGSNLNFATQASSWENDKLGSVSELTLQGILFSCLLKVNKNLFAKYNPFLKSEICDLHPTGA